MSTAAIEVLNVVDVHRRCPGPGQLLVRVKAAGINPGEAKIREGLLHDRWPATFPSGAGLDLAGVVEAVGDGRDGVPGRRRGDRLHRQPRQPGRAGGDRRRATPRRGRAGVPWEVAGSLFVAGATAYAAVRAVDSADGDTVVVSGAAGGVGSFAVQLAARAGATVIGLASESQPRVAARARRGPGDVRRRRRRPDPRGRARWRRRVHRHGRRRLRASWRWSSAWRRTGSTRSPISRRGQARRQGRRQRRRRERADAGRAGRR